MKFINRFYSKILTSKKPASILFLPIAFILFSNLVIGQQFADNSSCETFPSLKIKGENGSVYNYSFQIAMGDIFSNIRPYNCKMFDEEKSCLFAGMDYRKPWTRDAALNVWNGVGLIFPSICRNTLIAQLDSVDGKVLITGQYWDKIIWCIGAWNYYLYTGDKSFLQLAFDATLNTLTELRRNEFDPSINLFRSPAVYGDGVAAYPYYYTTCEDSTKNGSFSGILDWLKYNPDRKYPIGKGLPTVCFINKCSLL